MTHQRIVLSIYCVVYSINIVCMCLRVITWLTLLDNRRRRNTILIGVRNTIRWRISIIRAGRDFAWRWWRQHPALNYSRRNNILSISGLVTWSIATLFYRSGVDLVPYKSIVELRLHIISDLFGQSLPGSSVHAFYGLVWVHCGE